jgi:hypothetical protein
MRVTFALSNLAGRAKSWALGLKLHDPRCFGSLQEFKAKLRRTFEPPRVELRDRAEYLDLKQGKRDIHAYAQHARFLANSIVQDPIDEQKQITAFIKGLNDGPIKTHQFRVEPRRGDRHRTARGLQPAAGFRSLCCLSSTATTGCGRCRGHGSLVRRERPALSWQQRFAEMQPLSEERALRL